MKYYLILFCLPLINCVQSTVQKKYNLSTETPNVPLFSAITSLMALCFFLITSGFKLDFTAKLLPYSALFAVAYATAWITTVLALRYGSLAITNLIVSCSLIFPTAYGVWNGETLRYTTVAGTLLLFAAFALIHFKKGQKTRFSWKWFACVMAAFLCNGLCAITQNLQKRALGDEYSHEFMIVALAIAFALLMAFSVFTSRRIVRDLKGCAGYSVINGGANALLNLMLLYLLGNIPNTVIYPTYSALNLVAIFLLSFIVFRERFTKQEYVGYLCGMASVILLNL